MVMNKRYEDLCFTDAFMFGKVMREPEICKGVLEALLGREVQKIRYLEIEKTLDVDPQAKGVRFDVYLEGDDTAYNVEMQTTHERDLAKRSRYYQDIMDLNLLEKGKKYKELPQCMVIFICTFDPFDEGESVYPFENQCQRGARRLLADGTAKLFVNAKGNRAGLSAELCHLLDYICGQPAEDTLTQEIEAIVERVRGNQEWRREYMVLSAMLMDAKSDGYAEGHAEGWKEAVYILAQDYWEEGLSAVRISEKLQKRFGLSAADAENIVESLAKK